MTINQDYPIVDGIAPSWADIKLSLTPDGLPLISMKEIKSINTDWQVSVGSQQGASGGREMKRTTGSRKSTASITLYKSGYQKLIRTFLPAMPQRGNQRVLSLVHFELNMQMTPPGDIEIYERLVRGARIIGSTGNSQEGDDPDVIDCALSVSEIVDIIDGFEVVAL